MNAGLPSIWMNVTTSKNWQRPPVGIVRVESSLCDELKKLYGDRFKQCVWENDRFVEWNPSSEPLLSSSSFQEKREGVPGKLKESVLQPIYPILGKRQALITLAQSLMSLLPRWLQPYFNRLLYILRPNFVRLLSNNRLKHRFRTLCGNLKGLRFSANQKFLNAVPEGDRSTEIFAAGDVLISVGLDWDYSYYKKFYELRQSHGVKVVTCCYDLIPVLYPQYCVNDVAGIFTSYFLEIADGSDLVLCISRQSEKDLNEMLFRTGGAQPPTWVFPLGDNVPPTSDDITSPAVKAVCDDSFILFVSTIERRKNHEVLYRAYHLLFQQGRGEKLPKLVFVGMQGWGVNELLKDIELDPLTRDMIVRLNHVSDIELRALYESSLFCVFPSLYEGWGLPVGEALSMGKAVICSDRGSLPEVGGDLVRYVDPWSPQLWADEIYRMATDEAWRQEWEQKACNLYKTRTWSQAAESVKERIETLVNGGKFE